MSPEEIRKFISDFETRVNQSRNLAQETIEFLTELKDGLDIYEGDIAGEAEKTIQNEIRIEMVGMIERILTQEPDATLRGRLTDLVDRIKISRGDIDPQTVLTQILI